MFNDKMISGTIEEFKLNDILETLGDAIGQVDKNNEYGIGDRLFQSIIDLKQAFGIDIEE